MEETYNEVDFLNSPLEYQASNLLDDKNNFTIVIPTLNEEEGLVWVIEELDRKSVV
jgi:hypothetical protein